MAKAPQPPDAAPPDFAAPPSQTVVIETLLDIQRSLGVLTAQVENLRAASSTHDSKLDRLSHTVFAAGAVVAVLTALGGFVLSRIWDGVAELLRTLPPAP